VGTPRLGPLITVLVVLWRVVAIGAVIIYSIHQSRQDHVQPLSQGDAKQPPGRMPMPGRSIRAARLRA
jgi:hypothetical protein